MEYVEILRARRVLFWYVATLVASVVITGLSLTFGHVEVNGGSGHGAVELTWILVGCAFAAFIVAAFVAPGLSAESATVPIVWTRPVPRDAIGWRYVAVDVATILIAYVLLFLAALTFFAMFGALGRIAADSQWLQTLVLGVGTALMWYGLVVLVAARLPGRGTLVAGLSWPVFMIVAGVWAAPLPPVLHAVIVALNFLNPLAYMTGVADASGGTTQVHHAVALGVTARTVLVWTIAAVSTAAAVRLWSTREA